MRKISFGLFVLNLIVCWYFYSHKLPNALVITGAIILINLTNYWLFRFSRRADILEYTNLPNSEYWMSTPDTRIDAIGKLRKMVSLFGAWVNAALLFMLLYVYTLKFDRQNADRQLAYDFFAILGLMILALILYIVQEFRKPKDE